jgi:hypothetical protein
MAPLVAWLSGPEAARAKTEIALEDAGIEIFPPDHWALPARYDSPFPRQSFAAEEVTHLTALPSGEEPKKPHGFVAVLCAGVDELNQAKAAAEAHKWALRVHGAMPPKPQQTELEKLLASYERRIAHLESQLKNPPIAGGAVESPGWATQAGSFGAEQTRRAVFSAYARTAANTPGIINGGLIGATDCQLSAPASGMSVNVSVGEMIIPGNEGGSQGGYYALVSSQTNLAIATANATNPRIDTVCATMSDAAYTIPSGGTSGAFTLQVVTGTPTSGANLTNLSGAATLPKSSLLLGYVLVPANATSIITADIANIATVVLIGNPISGATTQPTRTLGSVYQPNTARATFVTAVGQSNNVSQNLGAFIGPTNSPSTQVGFLNFANSSQSQTLSFVVPPAWYYQISGVTSSPSLNKVTEQTL